MSVEWMHTQGLHEYCEGNIIFATCEINYPNGNVEGVYFRVG